MRSTSWGCYHVLALLSKTCNAEVNDVPGSQVHRGLLAHADARRGAGADDVAGHERHIPADVTHEVRHIEDHGLRVALLAALAVDIEPEGETLRVPDFIARHEPRAYGTEAVAALSLDPLAPVLELKGSLGNIVDDYIAGYVSQRLVTRHRARHISDDHPELDLPVGLLRASRNHDVIIRSDDGRSCLHEEHRLLREAHAGFGGMIGVVEADADHLADTADGGCDSWRAGDDGQGGGVDTLELLQRLIRQSFVREIVDEAGEVSQASIRGEQHRRLTAFGSNA